MAPASHQTVRLSRGSHSSPDHGTCVMELASMLAGEPFSDRPACVSPLIGAILRGYNDRVDDARRQDLYGCAARVVGTRAGAATERARIVRCRDAVTALSLGPIERRRVERHAQAALGGPAESRATDALAWIVARTLARRPERHAALLALVDALAGGPSTAPGPVPVPPRAPTSLRVAP